MLTMMAIPYSSSSQFYRGGAIRYIRALGSSEHRSSLDPSRRSGLQVLPTSASCTSSSSSSSAASLPPSPSPSPSPSSSSSSSSSSKKHTTSKSSNNNHDDASTVAIFPWRSESTLLARLNPEKVESIQQGLLLTSQSQTLHSNTTLNTIVTAYMFLNVPWYALLPSVSVSTFEHELATNISHAFVHGVAQLLVNVRNQSSNNNRRNNSSSSTSNTNTAASESNSILIGGNDEDEDEDDGDANTNNTLGIHFHETLEFDLHDDEVDRATKSAPAGAGNHDTTLTTIFQQQLIDLYQSSIPKFVQHQRQAQQTHEERDDADDEEHEKGEAKATNNTRRATTNKKVVSVDFQFGMVPYQTELVTLFSIPYISRTNIQTDTKLLALYQEMLEQPASHRPAYLRQLRSRYLDANDHAPAAEGKEMESTVIAQCLVWCHETFAIADPCTGHVFQGFSSSSSLQSTATTHDTTTNTTTIRKIPHLVRMERTVVTKKDPRTGTVYNDLSLHDWIITDIDDVLHGNLIL